MKFTATNLVDIRATNHTISAYVGDMEVLSMHTAGSWFIASEDATLSDIIRCGVALQDFMDAEKRTRKTA